jgi:hypothetical protein
VEDVESLVISPTDSSQLINSPFLFKVELIDSEGTLDAYESGEFEIQVKEETCDLASFTSITNTSIEQGILSSTALT